MSSAPVECVSSRAAARNSCETGLIAAFALDGFDENGADVGRKFCFQVGDVVEADKLHVRHDRRKWFAILLLVRGRDRAHGASVEAVFEGEKLCSQRLAFAALQSGIGAGQLQSCFPCLGAAVAEEGAVKSTGVRSAAAQARPGPRENRGWRCG